MALIFPRLARNFIKNGYFPTDSETLGRIFNFLAPANGLLRVLDPCCGEGAALADVVHALGERAENEPRIETLGMPMRSPKPMPRRSAIN